MGVLLFKRQGFGPKPNRRCSQGKKLSEGHKHDELASAKWGKKDQRVISLKMVKNRLDIWGTWIANVIKIQFQVQGKEGEEIIQLRDLFGAAPGYGHGHKVDAIRMFSWLVHIFLTCHIEFGSLLCLCWCPIGLRDNKLCVWLCHDGVGSPGCTAWCGLRQPKSWAGLNFSCCGCLIVVTRCWTTGGVFAA